MYYIKIDSKFIIKQNSQNKYIYIYTQIKMKIVNKFTKILFKNKKAGVFATMLFLRDVYTSYIKFNTAFLIREIKLEPYTSVFKFV